MAPQHGVISPDYTVVIPNKSRILPAYAETVLKSIRCRGELRTRVRGIVEGFGRLYTDDFNTIVLPVPPLEEQSDIMKHIAEYRANNHNGTSIEERPENIETGADFGNWELDTVVGKQGTKSVLMVMTERALNIEIIRKISSKSETCIVTELDKLERRYGSKRFREIFKTITCDNGCENLDYKGMERSALTKGQRTKIYYAHPYSAYERGSNECANKLIRRFVPKGSDISKFSKKQINYIENWINNYPRRMFGGFSSADVLNLLRISL